MTSKQEHASKSKFSIDNNDYPNNNKRRKTPVKVFF